MNSFPSARGGFTLIELSIVLVIIGLVIGGVMVGSVMIRNAALNSIYKERVAIEAAMNAYKLKYGALPGDDPRASSYFSGVTNGNASDYIDGNERFYVWHHLSQAQMIEGSYTGATGTEVPGTNVPRSTSVDGAFWRLQSEGGGGATMGAGLGNFQPHPPVTYLMFLMTAPNYFTAMTAEELFRFDTKYDDGLPGRGNILVYSAAPTTTCVNGSAPAYTTYRSTLTTKSCNPLFLLKGKIN